MKGNILLLIVSVCIFSFVQAQVGINTHTPVGIFHIDGKGDNVTNTTATKYSDDVIVQEDGKGGVSMGIGKIPESNMDLDLGSTNKGLILNRIMLSSRKDLTSVASPKNGMIVYSNSSDLPQTIYGFNETENEWEELYYDMGYKNAPICKSTVNVTTSGITTAQANGNNIVGVQVPFRSITATSGEVIMDLKGTYLFQINLVGEPTGITATKPSLYYVFLVRVRTNIITNVTQKTIIDKVSLTLMSAYSTSYALQTSLFTMAGEFNRGDVVKVMIAHDSGSSAPWRIYGGNAATLKNHQLSSLAFWLLV